ncbi:MAG: transglutaminase-like domain-containing protein [Thermoplasmata archaeon]
MKKNIIPEAYVAFSLVALAIVLSPTIISIWDTQASSLYLPIPSTLNGQFIRYINITSNSQMNLILNVTVPYNNTNYQKSSLLIDSKNRYYYNNGYNRTWITFIIKSSTNIKLIYNFDVKSISYPVSEYNSLNISYIPESLKKQYLGDEYLFGEKVIMPEMFKNITKNIVKNDTNVFQMEKSIYDYIVKNFKYKVTYTKENLPNSAWKTYLLGVGDCVELSFLYVSMSRAIGIPAWVECGWLYTMSTWAEHAWVGTLIPTNKGIVYGIIDLTEEVGSSDLGIGFFIRDPYRLTEWVDDGNSTHLTNYYTLLYGKAENYQFNEKIIPKNESFGQYALLPVPADAINPFIYRFSLVIGVSALIYFIIRKK